MFRNCYHKMEIIIFRTMKPVIFLCLLLTFISCNKISTNDKDLSLNCINVEELKTMKEILIFTRSKNRNCSVIIVSRNPYSVENYRIISEYYPNDSNLILKSINTKNFPISDIDTNKIKSYIRYYLKLNITSLYVDTISNIYLSDNFNEQLPNYVYSENIKTVLYPSNYKKIFSNWYKLKDTM